MARERVVVVGTGWAGYTLSQKLDERKFDITLVSPESTSPYTPLLVRIKVYMKLPLRRS